MGTASKSRVLVVVDDDASARDQLAAALALHGYPVITCASLRELDEYNNICTLADLERRHVERVLAHVRGNKAAAARILGIERKTLYRMLERWVHTD